jgi:hypothetical protein
VKKYEFFYSEFGYGLKVRGYVPGGLVLYVSFSLALGASVFYLLSAFTTL